MDPSGASRGGDHPPTPPPPPPHGMWMTSHGQCPTGVHVQDWGCFSIFLRADDVTRIMSKGVCACECPRVGVFFIFSEGGWRHADNVQAGDACECLQPPPPPSGNPVSAPAPPPFKNPGSAPGWCCVDGSMIMLMSGPLSANRSGTFGFFRLHGNTVFWATSFFYSNIGLPTIEQKLKVSVLITATHASEDRWKPLRRTNTSSLHEPHVYRPRDGAGNLWERGLHNGISQHGWRMYGLRFSLTKYIRNKEKQKTLQALTDISPHGAIYALYIKWLRSGT